MPAVNLLKHDEKDVLFGSILEADPHAIIACPKLGKEVCGKAGICQYNEETHLCEANPDSEVLRNLKSTLASCSIM